MCLLRCFICELARSSCSCFSLCVHLFRIIRNTFAFVGMTRIAKSLRKLIQPRENTRLTLAKPRQPSTPWCIVSRVMLAVYARTHTLTWQFIDIDGAAISMDLINNTGQRVSCFKYLLVAGNCMQLCVNTSWQCICVSVCALFGRL